jgi:hypothetical protein
VAKTQSKLFSFFTKIPTTKAAAAPTAPSPSEKLHKNQEEEKKTVQNYVVLVTLVPLLCSPLLISLAA